MKKITIDLRCIESPTGKRGVGYFNRYLFRTLLNLPHSDLKFDLFTFPGSRLRNQFKIGPSDKLHTVPALYWPKKGLRRLDPFFSIFWKNSINKIKPDLLHIPFLFDLFYLNIPDNIKTVITLYDIIPLLFPSQYFQNEKARKWYLQRLDQSKKAAKIITISKSSKSDIAKVLKIPAEKITVIYGGVDGRFKPMDKTEAKRFLRTKYKINKKYILTVSTHSFHKNISRIFLAFRSYLDSNKEEGLILVVIGRLIPQEERDWKEELKKMDLEKKVILTNFVPDEDLASFYCGAEVFLFPSLYEGLGLPVLEAMACGTAVITSNTSSLPEVGGDAAIYVNPKDSQDIKGALTQVLADETLRFQMIKKGFSQVKKFSWRKAAEQTLKVYQEVLESS